MYVPKILLCGNLKGFLTATQGRAIEVVGQISFKGAAERGNLTIPSDIDYLERLPLNPEDFQIFLDGTEISFNELKKILDGTADYIVFDNGGRLLARFGELCQLGLRDRFVTRESLLKYAADNFYSVANAKALVNILRAADIARLFDADFFFAKNDFVCTSFADFLQIETAGAVEDTLLLENLYAQIYPSPDACRFKHYDAFLMTAERSPEEFIDVLIDNDSLSDRIFAFVRKGSELESWLAANENIFAEVKQFPAVNGNWIFIRKRVGKDFCVYVVTHKDVKLDILPEGYRIIHAGHAVAKEKFGYLGDDTGENISALNRYLNEITALYWMWKNTRHAIIGLNHYRRFFTEADDASFAVEKILSRASAEKILRGCDMIVATGDFFVLTQHELKMLVCGDDLNSFIEKIFREHISRKQPEYLDAFDKVTGSRAEFMYEMFITRRKVFDAYCEWLFSFILDVTDDVLARTNLAKIDNPRKYRAIGLIAERLLTVWLMKNRLRLKGLPILYRDEI